MTRWANGLLGACLLSTLLWATVRDDAAGGLHRSAGAGGAAPAQIVQVTTIDGRTDRCPTCHPAVVGLASPGAAKPHRAHVTAPGHDLKRFGCTTCHGGQGRRIDDDAHAPRLGAGQEPFLKQPYLQARCVRCHVPTNLRGAEDLSRGIAEYLKAGCVGCHLPGHYDAGIGPDLRRLGRRTEAELREALLYPEKGHPDSAMFNLRWRYDQGTVQGRAALASLITAILAFSEPAAPFRDAWARPNLRIDAPCQSCHQEILGDKTTGEPHRCTLLRESPQLRCKSCHASTELRPRRLGQECPHIAQTRPTCSVCHLRSLDAVERRTR